MQIDYQFHETPFPAAEFTVLVLIHLLLMQSYFPIERIYFSLNRVAWSLSVEILFYYSFPLLIRLLHKLKGLIHTSWFITGMFCIWGVFTFTVWSLKDWHASNWLFYNFPVTRLIDFAVGICVGLIFVSFNRVKGSGSFRAASTGRFTILETFCVILVLIAFYLAPNFNQTLLYGAYFMPVWSVLIFIFAFQRGFFTKLLCARLLVKLGEVSFSFYMIHQLVIRYLSIIRPAVPLVLTHWLAFLVAVALSFLIYTYYEEPLRKKIRMPRTDQRKQQSEKRPDLAPL